MNETAKKRNNKLYLFIIYNLSFIISLTSCEKKPTACFSADNTSIETGQTVNFTNCSTNADHYTWTFYSGVISTDVNPSFLFYDAGIVNVTLEAYSKNSRKTNSVVQAITVTNPNVKYVGTWNINETHTSANKPTASDSYTISITAVGVNEISVNNFMGEGMNNVIVSTPAGNAFNILAASNVAGSFEHTNILSGVGTKTGNSISFSYTTDDSSYANYFGAFSATCTGTKQ